jgi:small nuclear ribonucleoprotein (snRNP)-like protein
MIGFDPFMNIVMEETVEQVSDTERNALGSVVKKSINCR